MKELTVPKPHTRRNSRSRPGVTVSYAQTLDGRLATVCGSSRWISSPDSLRFAHELRASHDAVLVGADTACRDNPSLTVRHCEGDDPLRVVVDSSLRTPLSHSLFSDGKAENTLVAVTELAPRERVAGARAHGAKVAVTASEDGRVDLGCLLEELGAMGVRSVMVEGGASLITSLLKGKLVDRISVCIAPKILGQGIEAVGDLGIRDLDHSVTLSDFSVVQYGPDFVFSGNVCYCDSKPQEGST